MANTVSPIKPQEVVSLKKTMIPDGVIAAFNEEIAKHFDGRKSIVKQDDVVDRITTTMSIDRGSVFEQKWLDVEDIYRGEGWQVTYDKPAFNETYPATFCFTSPR